MFYTKILLQVFILAQTASTTIRGPETIDVYGVCNDLRLSENSLTLLCSQFSNMKVIIFKNVGNSFQLHQILFLNLHLWSIDINKNGSKIFIGFRYEHRIDIYQQG